MYYDTSTQHVPIGVTIVTQERDTSQCSYHYHCNVATRGFHCFLSLIISLFT